MSQPACFASNRPACWKGCWFVFGMIIIVASPGPTRGAGPRSRTAMAPGSLAICNVNIIPMPGEAILGDMTVLVRDGQIAAIGKENEVAIPEGTRKIDGRAKFLIPGLADMHVHLYSDDEAPDSVAPDELGVILANGITTIRLMIGTPEHLALRREIEAGQIIGPQLWIASPQFTGRKEQNARVVTTPEAARAAVNEVADAGYDFIKLTVDITPEVFDAIVSAARERKIPIVGHVDPRVGVRNALKAGQHIEHLDNYMETILSDDAPTRRSVSNYDVFRPENWTSLDFIDQNKLRDVARATAASGTYTTPTLTIPKVAFGQLQADDEIRARPEWILMPPKTRDLYLRANDRYKKSAATQERRDRYIATRNQLVQAIQNAGGRIMAGSDSPEWFFGYGYTLHRELESLVSAGLKPFQAIEAATTTPAMFVGAERDWGRIAPSMRADLVLLSENPLKEIRHSTRIEAVCVGGRWLDRAELDRMVARAGERVGKPSS